MSGCSECCSCTEHCSWLEHYFHSHCRTARQKMKKKPANLNTTTVLKIQPNTLHLEREESTLVFRFLTDGFGCDLYADPCSSTFTVDDVENYMSQCSELTHGDNDMAILGQISAFTNTNTQLVHCMKHHHVPENL